MHRLFCALLSVITTVWFGYYGYVEHALRQELSSDKQMIQWQVGNVTARGFPFHLNLSIDEALGTFKEEPFPMLELFDKTVEAQNIVFESSLFKRKSQTLFIETLSSGRLSGKEIHGLIKDGRIKSFQVTHIKDTLNHIDMSLNAVYQAGKWNYSFPHFNLKEVSSLPLISAQNITGYYTDSHDFDLEANNVMLAEFATCSFAMSKDPNGYTFEVPSYKSPFLNITGLKAEEGLYSCKAFSLSDAHKKSLSFENGSLNLEKSEECLNGSLHLENLKSKLFKKSLSCNLVLTLISPLDDWKDLFALVKSEKELIAQETLNALISGEESIPFFSRYASHPSLEKTRIMLQVDTNQGKGGCDLRFVEGYPKGEFYLSYSGLPITGRLDGNTIFLGNKPLLSLSSSLSITKKWCHALLPDMPFSSLYALRAKGKETLHTKESQFALAMEYLEEGNIEKALHHLKISAGDGHAPACFFLGHLYYYGLHVPKSHSIAKRHLKNAVKHGYDFVCSPAFKQDSEYTKWALKILYKMKGKEYINSLFAQESEQSLQNLLGKVRAL